jgi:hypothetical protein
MCTVRQPLSPLNVSLPRPANVDFRQRSGHRVEADREHDGIDRVLAFVGPQPFGVMVSIGVLRRSTNVTLSRLNPAPTLGADRIVAGRQHLRHRWVADDEADLVAKELGRDVVSPLVHQQIGERKTEAEPAALPTLLVLAVPLLERDRQGGRVVAFDGEPTRDSRAARRNSP